MVDTQRNFVADLLSVAYGTGLVAYRERFIFWAPIYYRQERTPRPDLDDPMFSDLADGGQSSGGTATTYHQGGTGRSVGRQRSRSNSPHRAPGFGAALGHSVFEMEKLESAVQSVLNEESANLIFEERGFYPPHSIGLSSTAVHTPNSPPRRTTSTWIHEAQEAYLLVFQQRLLVVTDLTGTTAHEVETLKESEAVLNEAGIYFREVHRHSKPWVLRLVQYTEVYLPSVLRVVGQRPCALLTNELDVHAIFTMEKDTDTVEGIDLLADWGRSDSRTPPPTSTSVGAGGTNDYSPDEDARHSRLLSMTTARCSPGRVSTGLFTLLQWHWGILPEYLSRPLQHYWDLLDRTNEQEHRSQQEQRSASSSGGRHMTVPLPVNETLSSFLQFPEEHFQLSSTCRFATVLSMDTTPSDIQLIAVHAAEHAAKALPSSSVHRSSSGTVSAVDGDGSSSAVDSPFLERVRLKIVVAAVTSENLPIDAETVSSPQPGKVDSSKIGALSMKDGRITEPSSRSELKRAPLRNPSQQGAANRAVLKSILKEQSSFGGRSFPRRQDPPPLPPSRPPPLLPQGAVPDTVEVKESTKGTVTQAMALDFSGILNIAVDRQPYSQQPPSVQRMVRDAFLLSHAQELGTDRVPAAIATLLQQSEVYWIHIVYHTTMGSFVRMSFCISAQAPHAAASVRLLEDFWLRYCCQLVGVRCTVSETRAVQRLYRALDPEGIGFVKKERFVDMFQIPISSRSVCESLFYSFKGPVGGQARAVRNGRPPCDIIQHELTFLALLHSTATVLMGPFKPRLEYLCAAMDPKRNGSVSQYDIHTFFEQLCGRSAETTQLWSQFPSHPTQWVCCQEFVECCAKNKTLQQMLKGFDLLYRDEQCTGWDRAVLPGAPSWSALSRASVGIALVENWREKAAAAAGITGVSADEEPRFTDELSEREVEVLHPQNTRTTHRRYQRQRVFDLKTGDLLSESYGLDTIVPPSSVAPQVIIELCPDVTNSLRKAFGVSSSEVSSSVGMQHFTKAMAGGYFQSWAGCSVPMSFHEYAASSYWQEQLFTPSFPFHQGQHTAAGNPKPKVFETVDRKFLLTFLDATEMRHLLEQLPRYHWYMLAKVDPKDGDKTEGQHRCSLLPRYVGLYAMTMRLRLGPATGAADPQSSSTRSVVLFFSVALNPLSTLSKNPTNGIPIPIESMFFLRGRTTAQYFRKDESTSHSKTTTEYQYRAWEDLVAAVDSSLVAPTPELEFANSSKDRLLSALRSDVEFLGTVVACHRYCLAVALLPPGPEVHPSQSLKERQRRRGSPSRSRSPVRHAVQRVNPLDSFGSRAVSRRDGVGMHRQGTQQRYVVLADNSADALAYDPSLYATGKPSNARSLLPGNSASLLGVDPTVPLPQPDLWVPHSHHAQEWAANSALTPRSDERLLPLPRPYAADVKVDGFLRIAGATDLSSQEYTECAALATPGNVVCGGALNVPSDLPWRRCQHPRPPPAVDSPSGLARFVFFLTDTTHTVQGDMAVSKESSPVEVHSVASHLAQEYAASFLLKVMDFVGDDFL